MPSPALAPRVLREGPLCGFGASALWSTRTRVQQPRTRVYLYLMYLSSSVRSASQVGAWTKPGVQKESSGHYIVSKSILLALRSVKKCIIDGYRVILSKNVLLTLEGA